MSIFEYQNKPNRSDRSSLNHQADDNHYLMFEIYQPLVRNVQPNLGSREKYSEKWAKSDKLSSGNPNLHLLPSSKEM